MLRHLAYTIKGLSLGRPFSKIAKSITDPDVSVWQARRNADTQPLHYTRRKSHEPMQSATFKADVKKQKRMSNLKDRRILEP